MKKKRIFLVGAPQLDDINYKELIKKDNFYIQNNKVKINEGYLVILQHPVFKDQKKYEKIFLKTIKACQKFKLKYIIYPNYDPGYKSIIKILKKLKSKIKILIFKN